MDKKVLNAEDLGNLNIRLNIINQKQIELQMLTREKDFFLQELFKNYGLDISKKYVIDLKGLITEDNNDL